MTFARPGGGTLVIGPAALAVIDAHRQHDRGAPEAGGVLLGRVILERPDVLVDAATPPAPADRRSRFRFFRARAPAQAAINAAHAASGGERLYLGEWHTHPEDDPTPSGIDLADWRRLARDARFAQDALVFVIAGRLATRAWQVRRGSSSVEPLPPAGGRRPPDAGGGLAATPGGARPA